MMNHSKPRSGTYAGCDPVAADAVAGSGAPSKVISSRPPTVEAAKPVRPSSRQADLESRRQRCIVSSRNTRKRPRLWSMPVLRATGGTGVRLRNDCPRMRRGHGAAPPASRRRRRSPRSSRSWASTVERVSSSRPPGPDSTGSTADEETSGMPPALHAGGQSLVPRRRRRRQRSAAAVRYWRGGSAGT